MLPAGTGKGGSTDEWRELAEPSGYDPKPLDEREAGTLIQLRLSGTEERLTKPERDRTADNSQFQIADGTERGQCAARENTCAFDDALRRALWRATCFFFNGAATAIGLHAAPTAAGTVAPIGLDDDVTDVTGITEPTLQQSPAADDASAHTGTHDHRCEVSDADCGTTPGLAERDGLRVVVHDGGQLRQSLDLGRQRERLPGRDVQRSDRALQRVHRPATADAAANWMGRRRSHHAQYKPRERGPHFARRRRDSVAHEHVAGFTDDSRGQFGPSDVDGEVADTHVDDGSGLAATCSGAVEFEAPERQPPVSRSTLPAVTAAPTEFTSSPGPSSEAASRPSPTFAQLFDAIAGNVSSVVHGKRDAVELAVMCLLAEGHLLIEDVPGVGKTSLAKALAASIDCTWKRVQFTPDLLPTDLVGVGIFQRASESFVFQQGPLFANIVLADEINRASPKTQSALLEAMEERQVSADGVSHQLPTPFMVAATQNPVEQEGTYRLPESQLDRFLMRLSLGYPGREAELAILDSNGAADSLNALRPVVSTAEVVQMCAAVRTVHIADVLKGYMVDLAETSRNHNGMLLGLSPRATLQLARATRSHAAAHGRDYAIPDDVKAVAIAVLAHRIVLRPDAASRGLTHEGAVHELLAAVPVPVGR